MGRDQNADLRKAVEFAAKAYGTPLPTAVVESIVKQVSQLPEFQQYRDLRWKFKTMAKASGKQGATIYELKCQLAELRGLMDAKERAGARHERDSVDRAGLQATIALQDGQIQRLTEQLDYQDTTLNLMRSENVWKLEKIQELEQRLEAAAATIEGLESKLALARQVRDHGFPYSPYFPKPPADVPQVTCRPGGIGPVIGDTNDQVSA